MILQVRVVATSLSNDTTAGMTRTFGGSGGDKEGIDVLLAEYKSPHPQGREDGVPVTVSVGSDGIRVQAKFQCLGTWDSCCPKAFPFLTGHMQLDDMLGLVQWGGHQTDVRPFVSHARSLQAERCISTPQQLRHIHVDFWLGCWACAPHFVPENDAAAALVLPPPLQGGERGAGSQGKAAVEGD